MSAFIFFSVFGVAPRAYTATPGPTLFVADFCTRAVTAYPATSNGDVSPLAPAPTGLGRPTGVAIDASGNIYVANSCGLYSYITVYSAGSNGNIAPIAVIGGSNTGLRGPEGIAVDSSGRIYAADYETASVQVYSAGSNGNIAPIATISGSNTSLDRPYGIVVDSSGKIYVADDGDGSPGDATQSVLVYAAGSNGNVAPIATISGSNTGLGYPSGIVVDSSGKIYVANSTLEGSGWVGSVLVYSTGSNGNIAPIATISGINTGLNSRFGIAVDSTSKIYVLAGPSLFVYSAGSNGDAAPIATIGGRNTGLERPQGIAVDSTANIYVAEADDGAASVLVYAAGSSGNVAPSATISTTMTTGLKFVSGIAVDSSGQIYVAGAGGPGRSDFASVFVYPAASNGNAAPVATISGSDTDLGQSQGIAVDSRGSIYVAGIGYDADGNSIPVVLVYPAGSDGDIAPIATISGSRTGLNSPQGIAVTSSGKVYVADDGDFTAPTPIPSVFVYAAGSKGNARPIATISGSRTGLNSPQGIAVDSSGNIYVADPDAGSVFVYSAGSKGNAAPIATISGSNTGLSNPFGIAVDSSRDMYVADPPGVFVYSAGSHGNVAPIATVGGPFTELGDPQFLAIQSADTVGSATTLSAVPSKLNFGKVDATGTSKPRKVTLTNKGRIPAAIGSVTATPPFAIAGGADTCSGQSIAPNKKCSFDVEFAPVTVANVTGGSIGVTYNGSSPTVALEGDGIAVALTAPKSESFATVHAGTAGKPRNIQLSNSSTVPVTLEAATMGAPDSGSFTIAGDGCSRQLLAAKGKCTVAIKFAPPAAASGAQTSTLSFGFTYGANNGSVSIALKSKVRRLKAKTGVSETARRGFGEAAK